MKKLIESMLKTQKSIQEKQRIIIEEIEKCNDIGVGSLSQDIMKLNLSVLDVSHDIKTLIILLLNQKIETP